MLSAGVAENRRLWRRVLAADLGVFNVAVFMFALLPPSTLKAQEWIIMAGAVLAGIGVVSHASTRIHLWGEGYAYLATSMVGGLTLLIYAHLATAPYYVKIPYVLFLLSGVVSGLAAHVIDGGPENG